MKLGELTFLRTFRSDSWCLRFANGPLNSVALDLKPLNNAILRNQAKSEDQSNHQKEGLAM